MSDLEGGAHEAMDVEDADDTALIDETEAAATEQHRRDLAERARSINRSRDDDSSFLSGVWDEAQSDPAPASTAATAPAQSTAIPPDEWNNADFNMDSFY